MNLDQLWGILFSMGKYNNKGWQGRFFLQKSRVDLFSLTGSDMKKELLSNLSSKLLVCEGVPVNAREKISHLWDDFNYIYTIINTWSPSQDMMSQFCDLAKQWVININFTKSYS